MISGISPLTPDHVNPEAPWPELANLSNMMTSLGKCLTERLAIYPFYAVNHQQWVDSKVLPRIRQLVDQQGFAREDNWFAGQDNLPNIQQKFSSGFTKDQNTPVAQLLEKIASGCETDESEVIELLNVRGDFFRFVKSPMICVKRSVEKRLPTLLTATSTTPISAISAADFVHFPKEKCQRTCVANHTI